MTTIQRPPGMGGFQFAVLATLRAQQLLRGCTPRVDGGHKHTVTAQFEISEGKVKQFFAPKIDVSKNAAPSEPVLEEALAVVDAI